MTQIGGVLVVFDRNAHPDQVKATREAIWQLKGVIGVCEVYQSPEQAIEDVRAVAGSVRVPAGASRR